MAIQDMTQNRFNYELKRIEIEMLLKVFTEVADYKHKLNERYRAKYN